MADNLNVRVNIPALPPPATMAHFGEHLLILGRVLAAASDNRENIEFLHFSLQVLNNIMTIIGGQGAGGEGAGVQVAGGQGAGAPGLNDEIAALRQLITNGFLQVNNRIDELRNQVNENHAEIKCIFFSQTLRDRRKQTSDFESRGCNQLAWPVNPQLQELADAPPTKWHLARISEERANEILNFYRLVAVGDRRTKLNYLLSFVTGK